MSSQLSASPEALAPPRGGGGRVRPSLPRRRASDTRRFYDEQAASYAAATQDPSRGASVDGFLALLPGAPRVVDLGSGAGRDLRAFVSAGADAVGLDFSAALAGIARRSSGAPVVVADMVDMPFPGASFDGAWASASLLHLGARDMRSAFGEVRRVLRPGGVLFTSMKGGRGRRREPCGRWFSYVEPSEWLGRLDSERFDVVRFDEQLEVRPGVGEVSWLTCLSRRR